MTSLDPPTERNPSSLRRRTVLAGLGTACLSAGCSGLPITASSPSVSAPEFSHVGDPFPVTVDGVDGGATVEIAAVDRLDRPYSVRLPVRAEGTVADPRMLFHRLEFAGRSGTDAPPAYVPRSGERIEVDVVLRRDGEELDSVTVTREYIDPAIRPETIRTNVHEEERRIGEFYAPPGDARGPGVLTLHGSDRPPKRRMSKVLASRGYPTLALRYRGFDHDSWGWVPIEYLTGAVDYLRNRSEVTDGRVGVVGHSMGGSGALLTGIHSSAVGAVVSYDGPPTRTGIQGPEPPYSDTPFPPWFTLDGEIYRTHGEVQAFWEAFLREIDERGGVENCDYDRYKESYAALDPETQAKNTYRVEEIDGPVLLVATGATPRVEHMPASESLKRAFRRRKWTTRRVCVTATIRLDQHGHDYRYGLASYGDAPHIVGLKPPYSLTDPPSYLDTPVEPLVDARAGAWPRVLDYLADGIGRSPDDSTATAASAGTA